MSDDQRLASELNAKLINQRFAELEKEQRDQRTEMREELQFLRNEMANQAAIIEGQRETIAKIFALAYGTGEPPDPEGRT